MGEDQEAERKIPGNDCHRWFWGRRFNIPSVGRHGDNFHVAGSSRSSHFLPRCSAHDVACRRQGRDSASAAIRASPYQVGVAKHWRTSKPHGDGESAHMRQLPFFFARWQDDGVGYGWTAERQGTVRAGFDFQEHDHPQSGCPSLEFLPGESRCPQFRTRGEAVRVHVAGLAGRPLLCDVDRSAKHEDRP